MKTISVFFALSAMSAFADLKPFAVDMYVKDEGGNGTHCYRGTRTPHWGYPEAGWSVGLMDNGEFVFVIGDDTNMAFVRQKVLDTDWREGEWNHIAGCCVDNEMRLWINGVRSKRKTSRLAKGFGTNRICVATLDSPRPVVTNGYDAMTGGQFIGQIHDWRFLERELSDAEVKERAAVLRQMREKDRKNNSLVPDEKGIDVAPPEVLTAVPLTIQPKPQQAEMSRENVLIKGPVAITAEEGPFMQVAKKSLKAMLEETCALKVGDDVEAARKEGTLFSLKADATLRPEEYLLEGETSGTRACVRISAAGHALFYGIDTLRQLLRIRSLENGKRLSMPADFSIRDWPLVKDRIAVFDLEYVDRIYGRKFALGRMNGMGIKMCSEDEKDIAKAVRTLSPYGVKLINMIQYNRLRNPYTFSKPETMKAYDECLDRMGRAGVRGLAFMFDDLSGLSNVAWRGDKEMRRRFRSEGAFHNALIMYAIEYAKKHHPHLCDVLTACPRHYIQNYIERAKKDYADFSKGFREHGATVKHCAVSENVVASIRMMGIEECAYNINGLWPTSWFFNWFVAPESYRWAWYTWYVDLNGIGPKVLDEAMASVRTVHNRASMVWIASNALMAVLQGGIVAWNPPAFDPVAADRAAVQAFFGSGVYEPLHTFETALMPIIGYLGAFRMPFAMDGDVKIVPRRVGLSMKEINGYRRNFAAAEKAYEDVLKAIAAQESIFDRPGLAHPGFAKERVKWLPRAMRKTLDGIRPRIP